MEHIPLPQGVARPARYLRLAVRLAVLVAGVTLAVRAVDIPRAGEWSAVLPALSPHLAVFSAIALRGLPVLFLLCVPVLLLVVFRRRWFCRNACPTGLLTEYAGMLLPDRWRLRRFPRIARGLVLVTAVGSLVGYPLFLWLDPLAMLHGLVSGWRTPLVVWNLLPGAMLAAVIVVSVLWPGAWCFRACPLGECQELIYRPWRVLPRRRRGAARQTLAAAPVIGRRAVLAGAGVLMAGAGTLFIRRAQAHRPVLRPPGSVADGRFPALCARCGNCMRACPSGIIRPDVGVGGMAGLLAPTLDFAAGYCLEDCHACNAVCSTDAIAHLTLEQKRRHVIGLAAIDCDRCWVWKGQRECDKCAVVCPTEAIDTVESKPPMPVVVAARCNGCGKCIASCPVGGGPAIRVCPA